MSYHWSTHHHHQYSKSKLKAIDWKEYTKKGNGGKNTVIREVKFTMNNLSINHLIDILNDRHTIVFNIHRQICTHMLIDETNSHNQILPRIEIK